MQKINIDTPSKHHSCYLGNGILKELPQLCNLHKLPSTRFVIIDSHVANYWYKEIESLLSNAEGTTHYYIMPSGEKSKSLKLVQAILETMVDLKINKDSVIIAIGGGVCGDLAGFIASIYSRGIGLVHIPTSLLAMIDSSIGGKNGIDFAGKKNNVGAIYQADFILTDTAFLKTLSRQEFLNGCGELIKYAYLSDNLFFEEINKFAEAGFPENIEDLQSLIYQSIQMKVSVVSKDERESDLRKVLNLGHTFAHGIESASHFKMPHGMAVGAGILACLIASFRLSFIDEEKLKLYSALPLSLEYPPILQTLSPESIIEFMIFDKKSKDSTPQFVLLKSIGQMVLNVSVPREIIYSSIQSAVTNICQDREQS